MRSKNNFMINRPIYLKQLIKYKDKDIIKVITGVRRCGKSVLLFDLYCTYLSENGVSNSNIIKVNLEDLENVKLRDSLELYTYIKKRIINNEKYYVMIDEIQYIDDFEDLVNTLKNIGADVYITGSNSKLLSGNISTKLRGRSIEIKVYPFSFAEFYNYKGGDKLLAYNEYQMYGGFPYTVTEPNHDSKIEYLKMLESTVATKDIIDRYNIRNPNLFDAVYSFLCSNIGSTVSAKKISDTLKSNGYTTITADTVGNYLEYLCEAFMFYKVYRYDIKGKEYLKTLNKYYISDIGLRNCKLQFRQLEVTHTLENIVYQELIRRGYMVDIGKNKDKEIDFIARNSKDTFYLQVAYSIIDQDKKEQELSSFYKIDDGYKKIVISMDSDPFSNLEKGYKKLNVFDFLLNEHSLEEC